jgi:hypothetical protein
MAARGVGWVARPLARLRPFSARTRLVTQRGLCGASATDPWATLGVPRNSDLDDCKAAFRRLARELHPDVSSDAADAAAFAEVVEAYRAIEQGDAEVRPIISGPAGVRVVGGILIVSVDVLRRDPAYDVHTLRVRFEEALQAEADAAVPPPPQPSAAGDALSTETVREVHTSAWDSVADLRMLLEAELELPERLRRGGRRHELIYRGQLLGEHLFLGPDYEIADGDIVHFAAARDR